MSFRQMDPEKIWALLEEKDEKGEPLHRDMLTPLFAKEDLMLRNVPCPVCGGYGNEVFLNPKRPFTPGSPLPNRLLRCLGCSSEFDPLTRIILSARREPG